MSDWFGDRAAALVGLRRAQTRVVTRVVPEIATEPGAVATPSMLQLDGPRGGRYVRQRVCVERTAARFDEGAAFAAATAEWSPSGDASTATTRKRDGVLRYDLATSDGEFHSVTLLHGGRVLQLTSFSRELDVSEPDSADAADDSGFDDDAFSADTLAAPPDPAELAALRDPRPDHVAAEERDAGPDYGYQVRNGR